jgi:hypothetical protein
VDRQRRLSGGQPARPGEMGGPLVMETVVDEERRLGVVQFEHGYLALSSRGLAQMIDALQALKADVEAIGG